MTKGPRSRRGSTRPATERQLAALRGHAAQRQQESAQENYCRLATAIKEIEDKRDPVHYPVSVRTIREVCGLEYMSYARYPHALALFRAHSARLRQKRQKRTGRAQTEATEDHQPQPRDRLLAYTKAQLAARVRMLMQEQDDLHRQTTVLLNACIERDRRILDLEATVTALAPYKEIAMQLGQLGVWVQEKEHDAEH